MTELRHIQVAAPADVVAAWDQQAKMRGMSRSQFFIYLGRAFDQGLVMVADWSTWGKWEQEQLNKILRAARVAAREEVKLYLYEQGFTSEPYEK